MYGLFIKWASPGAQLVKNQLTNAGDIIKVDSITGSGRSPGYSAYKLNKQGDNI